MANDPNALKPDLLFFNLISTKDERSDDMKDEFVGDGAARHLLTQLKKYGVNPDDLLGKEDTKAVRDAKRAVAVDTVREQLQAVAFLEWQVKQAIGYKEGERFPVVFSVRSEKADMSNSDPAVREDAISRAAQKFVDDYTANEKYLTGEEMIAQLQPFKTAGADAMAGKKSQGLWDSITNLETAKYRFYDRALGPKQETDVKRSHDNDKLLNADTVQNFGNGYLRALNHIARLKKKNPSATRQEMDEIIVADMQAAFTPAAEWKVVPGDDYYVEKNYKVGRDGDYGSLDNHFYSSTYTLARHMPTQTVDLAAGYCHDKALGNAINVIVIGGRLIASATDGDFDIWFDGLNAAWMLKDLKYEDFKYENLSNPKSTTRGMAFCNAIYDVQLINEADTFVSQPVPAALAPGASNNR